MVNFKGNKTNKKSLSTEKKKSISPVADGDAVIQSWVAVMKNTKPVCRHSGDFILGKMLRGKKKNRCVWIGVLCRLGLTLLLLHLFLQLGVGVMEEEEGGMEQCLVSPIRARGCSAAPLLGLQMNKLYPEILSPPPPPPPPLLFFRLLPPLAGWFVSSEQNITAIYLFSPF